jgi:hypothetical protein
VSHMLPESAYSLYKQAASESALSLEEFRKFWLSLKEEDRAWWLRDFSTGHTKLNKELLDFGSVFEAVRRRGLDPALCAAIDAVVTPEHSVVESSL